MTVTELVAELGFKFDDTDLKKFDEGLASAAKGATIAVSGITAASAAVFAFVKEIAEGNDELGKMSQQLGIATAELQGWQHAAELGGSTTAAMSASLENLSKRASEAARGVGSGVEVFGMLGISATTANGKVKDTSLLMEEVAGRVSKLSTQSEKLEFLEKLGISTDLLVTLDQGSEALKRQRLEAEQLGFALDENATKSAANFNDELLRSTKIVGGVASAVGTALMPEITEMLKIFKLWFIANKELIKQNLNKFLSVIVTSFKTLFQIAKRVFNVFDALVGVVGGWTNALGIATAAFVAFNAAALVIPVSFVAIATAIFLLVEDIVNFFQGNESVLGDLVARFPILGAAINKVADIVVFLKDVFTSVFNALPVAINKIIDNFTRLKNTISGIFDGISNTIESIGSSINEYIVGPIGKIADTIGGIFGSDRAIDLNNLNSQQITTSPAIAASNQSTNMSSNNNFTATINIPTTTGSPQETAQVVRKELDTWFKGVNSQTQKDFESPFKN